MKMPSDRVLLALPLLGCAALLAFGYYLQYFQDQEPCPLCLVQRGFYYALIGIFGAAALHDPKRLGRILYCTAALLAALGGAAVAARQVWLQHLPKDQVPECGPDLFFMMKNLTIQRTLEKLFRGSGQCAEVNWTFLGLSIAEWSLACFTALALYALWLALRKRTQ
jgi:protein dithiol:quinone oxidoreductase